MAGVKTRSHQSAESRRAALTALITLAIGSILAVSSAAPGAPVPEQTDLLITVLDENQVAVPGAQVTLTAADMGTSGRSETDYAGHCRFAGLDRVKYNVRVEKEGFFVLSLSEVDFGTGQVELVLNHQHELVEHINVVYSPPLIDPANTTSNQELTSQDIVDLPYTVTRDIRYALPLLPGVLQDGNGQLHVDGSYSRQTFDTLDGFNINAPASGQFTMRLNVDAVRSAEVQASRYPVEFGKGSGGVIALTTGMGDDHLRFAATDFVPSIQARRGLHINTWTPRGTISGPIDRGKAWFLLAPEGEYDMNIIQELPPGGDRSSSWRAGNLAKTQINVTPGNVLTGTYLVNEIGATNAGLSRFDPVSTTVDQHSSASFLAIHDQAFLGHGMLLDTGLAQSWFDTRSTPHGTAPYVITPEASSGNFFESAAGHSRRLEGIADLILPPVDAWGRHVIKVGADSNRIVYRQSYERRRYEILREDRTLSRQVAFSNTNAYKRDNTEASVYAEDHWSSARRLVVEPGVRLDWDQVVRQVLVSPRVAGSYMLLRGGETKIVAGVGRYYDQTNLSLLTLPLGGERTDYFYDPSGQTLVRPPVVTSFTINEQALRQAAYLNWSVGLERRLPGAVYSHLEYTRKRGHNGWAYLNPCTTLADCYSGDFTLSNIQNNNYDSIMLSARRSFRGGHMLFAAYTHSKARSSAALDFNLENPTFSPQVAGPLPWDAPNRVQSWGFLPLGKVLDVAYFVDWRDGFPFGLVNQDQQLVAPPGARRFPTYFALNLAFERRVMLFGYQWAFRAGFNDITNRHNPFAVDNNINSPTYLTYTAIEGRALVARIRLLGRK